ncbi:GIN domain-containing protein [Formosa haliotis]|uniref:GIN domain-containing protein n=1 Tax=Formosa haliotis TaxID=1555194 RepID=UPI0008247660|nr:DUF2807 domain-containing protein [Formosa haliotis]
MYGDGNLKTVDLYVENGQLNMSDVSASASQVVVFVQHPDISSIVVQNNGTLEFDNNFVTSSSDLIIRGYDAAEIYNAFSLDVAVLDVALENAAKMALVDVEANELYVQLSDGSRCNMEGFATEQYINLNNGCRFNLDFPYAGWEVIAPIRGVTCNITTDNGGNGWVQAVNTLTATANNGSSIFYQGEPKVLNITEINGGTVSRKDF